MLQVTEDTPAIVLLYRTFTRENVYEGIEWMREQRDTRGALPQIHATPIEQKLLLKLLKNNASLVPPELEVDRTSTEVNYRLSVLLPIGPLEFEDIASLNKVVGCSVCGKKEASKCSQCLTVTYCSKEVCDQVSARSKTIDLNPNHKLDSARRNPGSTLL